MTECVVLIRWVVSVSLVRMVRTIRTDFAPIRFDSHCVATLKPLLLLDFPSLWTHFAASPQLENFCAKDSHWQLGEPQAS